MVGDKRIVRRFFLFPRKYGDVWIWLEFGDVLQRRVESYVHGASVIPVPVYEWRDESLIQKTPRGL